MEQRTSQYIEEQIDRVQELNPTEAEKAYLRAALEAHCVMPRKLNSGNSAVRVYLLELRAARQRNGVAPVLALGLWVPCAVSLPQPQLPVLLRYRNPEGKMRRTYALYAPKHTLQWAPDWPYEGITEEHEGESYAPEGWYHTSSIEDENVIRVMGEPVEWLHLKAEE